MNSYVALLRGINVGGKNKLPMQDLKTLLERLGLTSIETYIQSGNVIFESNEVIGLAEKISAAIGESHGFEPKIWLLEGASFNKAVQANPFPEAEAEPKTLHLYFLYDAPESINTELLEKYAKENERFKLIDKVFYLHAPDGIGRSKIAERIEKALGVAATARNWRTVSQLKTMLDTAVP